MKKLIYAGLICTAVGFYACNGNSNSTSTSDSTTTTTMSDDTMNMQKTDTAMVMANWNDNDKNFAQEAGRGGKMEVELGNIAKANASSQDVKDFGKMMVDDHSMANDELTTLLKNKGVNVDMAYTNDQQSEIDKLSKEKGKEFDKDYVKTMLDDHKKDVAAFKSASQTVSDPDLKNWIDKTLPTLQKHLDAIQKISDKMK